MILNRDDTFRVVFSLRTPKALPRIEVGTGIFVIKHPDEIYLLTASHVAKACDEHSEVVVNDTFGKAISLKLKDFNSSLQWIHHPVADLSILPIQMTEVLRPHMDNRFFPLDHFHLDETSVSRDAELTAVGFPHGLGSIGLFSPLTYRSFASSAFISLNRFDTNTPCVFFLLENPSIAGYSGCPIFDLGYGIVGNLRSNKDKTRCYGIMHGTIADMTGGKLAAVTPAFYLRDLIAIV